MPQRPMQAVEAGDYVFYFPYDRKRTTELHIELMTGVDVETAVDTFFGGLHWWNERRGRFEGYTEKNGLYWAWLYGDETSSNVLVISCFPLEED